MVQPDNAKGEITVAKRPSAASENQLPRALAGSAALSRKKVYHDVPFSSHHGHCGGIEGASS
jgi:hypothetical protein